MQIHSFQHFWDHQPQTDVFFSRGQSRRVLSPFCLIWNSGRGGPAGAVDQQEWERWARRHWGHRGPLWDCRSKASPGTTESRHGKDQDSSVLPFTHTPL